jgi:hypothetical protein
MKSVQGVNKKEIPNQGAKNGRKQHWYNIQQYSQQ